MKEKIDELYKLAEQYYDNEEYEKALKYFIECAENGHAKSQHFLSIIYYLGEGAPLDEAESEKWLLLAALNNCEEAYSELADRYFKGGVLLPQNFKKAFEWYQKSAEVNDKDGQLSLANCYFNGFGVDVDYFKALYWCEKAVQQGNKMAVEYLTIFQEKMKSLNKCVYCGGSFSGVFRKICSVCRKPKTY